MNEGKKKRGVDPIEQRNSGLMFARVTALMSIRAMNVVLKYELAAVPTSIFDGNNGELRISMSSPSSNEHSRCELQIPQDVSETLWLLMDEPYPGCYNDPAKD